MDEGEIDLSSEMLFPNPETPTSIDDFLRNTTTTCTHTHTCNPPGPLASAHTHTCHHTHSHSHVFSTDDDSCGSDKVVPKKTREPLGNRVAVRKYRQKKKAHTAHLEEEVRRLRAINQQLVKRLQGQAALKAEVVRLRTLLVDVRAKIDGALGSYPFQTQCGVGDALSCDRVVQCLAGKSELGMNSNCGPVALNCDISPDSGQNLGTPYQAGCIELRYQPGFRAEPGDALSSGLH
ncbi:hypothetical protein BRADI_4g43322v3 [Brachypodium distachyon]|uniref:BZIP domain-containing protein n=1 Tax=Brachypodium distachyon TaxID=15368 RepID=A0A0Q3LIL2_BRADI|nr:hypothetical protein BRADI_4g43322v3 [Brachypodium distachyon]